MLKENDNMTINLNALKQKLNNKTNEASTNHFPVFSFSKLNPGDTIAIRLLEDGDEENSNGGQFWVQRHTRTLQFPCALLPDGSVINNRVYVTLPAFNLRGQETKLDNLPDEYLFKSDDDIIQQEIKPLYVQDDPTSQQLYKKFQKKVNYVYQGFVRAPGYETKIYRFIFSKAVHDLIYDGTKRLFNELGVVPVDTENGYDFILNVKEKTVSLGGRPVKMKDYASSSFALKSTPLTDAEKEYLESHPLFTLKDYIFRKPTKEQSEIMLEMYKASFNEEPYDVTRWASYFRPDNIQIDANGNVKNLKQNESTASEIPTSSGLDALTQLRQVAQPVQTQTTTTGQAFYAQPQQVQQEAVQNFQQQPNWNGYNAPENKQMLVDSPVAVEQRETAPQIASKVSETVSSTNPEQTINDIMARLMHK